MPRIKCPNCKSSNTCRILYGLPEGGDELKAEAEAGRVHFGGRDVTFDDPSHHCNECGTDFDTKTPRSTDDMLNDG